MISLLIFLSSFAFYLSGASPTLYGGDSGEFMASAYVLGIPHAPGYPTYNLLAKAVCFLIPFGHFVFRCNVFAAIVSACLITLFHRFLRNLFSESPNPLPPLIGTAILFMTPIFIEQARVVEVFGLNALFFVSVCLCLLLWKSSLYRTHWLVLSSLLFGLGLGNHHTLIVLFPLVLYATWKEKKRAHAFLLNSFFIFLGLGVYAYLPLRAHLNPSVNFGDPETLSRFWAVVSRKEFGVASLHPAALPFRDVHLMAEQFLSFVKRNQTQLGVSGIFLTIMGGWLGIRQKEVRFLSAGCLFLWLIFGFGFEVLSNLSPHSDIGQWRLERFFMIPLMACVTLIAIGLKGRGRLAKPAQIGALLLILGLFVERAQVFSSSLNFRANFLFHDFAMSALRSAPMGSKIVLDRVLFDEPTSSLLVRQQVQGKREDIQFFYRPGTLFEMLYGDDILSLPWEERFKRQEAVEKELLSNDLDRVRCLAFEKANTPFKKPVLDGLLYREGKALNSLSHLSVLIDRSGLLSQKMDYPRRLIKVHFPYFLGKRALEQGDRVAAKQWFHEAAEMGPDMAWLMCNVGSLYAHADSLEESASYYNRAVANDPYFYEGHYGLGYTALKAQDYQKAAAEYALAVRLSPQNPDGFYMLGVSYSFLGKTEKAKESWRTYLRLAPYGKMAQTVRAQLNL